jgi:hypothetical protein
MPYTDDTNFLLALHSEPTLLAKTGRHLPGVFKGAFPDHDKDGDSA